MRAKALAGRWSSRQTATDIMPAKAAEVPTSAQLTARTPDGAASTQAAIMSGTRTTLTQTMVACLPTAFSRSPRGKTTV